MDAAAAGRIDWLRVSALATLAFVVIVFALAGDRAYWYDEVFTLGAAAIGHPLDWQVLTGDVHPPTHPLAVRLMGTVLPPDSHALRLANLAAVPPVIGAALILRRHLDADRMALLTVMLGVNLYVLLLGPELRSYAFLIAFAFLSQAALLDRLGGDRPRTGILILSAAVLTSLHFFGAAIGLACLAVAALADLRARRWGRALPLIVAGLALTGALLFWIVAVSDALATPSGSFWIRNEIGPYLDFLGWQMPVFAAIVAGLLAARGSGAVAPLPRGAWLMLAPVGIVLAAAALISIRSPVISSRNLSVLVPGAALAVALWAPRPLLDWLRRAPWPFLLIAAVGLRYADTATRGPQAIRWAVETVATPGCAGVPIHVIGPGIVDEMAQTVFLGRVVRPLRDISEFDPLTPPDPDCTTVAMAWHEVGTVAQFVDYFGNLGVAVQPLPPPDPRLAARGLITHGVVLERLPRAAAAP